MATKAEIDAVAATLAAIKNLYNGDPGVMVSWNAFATMFNQNITAFSAVGLNTNACTASLTTVANDINASGAALRALIDAAAALAPTATPVAPPPPIPTTQAPQIQSFKATPAQINSGEPVLLSWAALNVAVSRINGKPIFRPIDVLGTPGAMASMTVAPKQTSTYTLEIEDSAGVKISQSVTVTVVSPQMALPQIVQQKLNLSAIVGLQQYAPRDRYQRFAVDLVLVRKQLGYVHDTGTFMVGLPFNKVDYNAGGAVRVFSYPKYGLLINGNERGTCTPAPGAGLGTFIGSLTDEVDGDARFEIVAYDASGNRVTTPVESYPIQYGHINIVGGAKNSLFAVSQTNSFEWEKDNQQTHAFVVIPKANLKPLARPLFPGALEHFSTALPSSQIERSNLIPANDENTNQLHYACLMESGATTMQTCQGYEPTIMYAQQAALPHLDGPRGITMDFYPLAMWVGLNGKIYYTEPGSFSVIDLSGTKRTLAGIRHMVAPYHKEISRTHAGPYSEVVGVWDPSIPVAEQFIQESWGIAGDVDSFALDPTTIINGIPAHMPPGPRFLLADVHGYILVAQANGQSHSAPYAISRLCAVSYPWSLAWSKEGTVPVVTVTERNAFRISKWHAQTGASLGTLLSNSNGAAFVWFDSLDQTKAVRHDFHYQPGVTITQCRAQPFLYGEGYVEQDGFAYWGCSAQQEIRRVNKATGKIEVCCRIPWGWLSSYVHIAISDGTFGPRGTLFATTFSNNGYGRPFAYLPTPGVAADGIPLTHSKVWAYHIYQPGAVAGMNGSDSASYATAVGVGNGLLVAGTCQRGLDIYRKSTSAPTDYARATRGKTYWYSKSYQILWGPNGYGPTNYPLPWGENPDVDYYLTLHGHERN